MTQPKQAESVRLADEQIKNLWLNSGGMNRGIDGVVRAAASAWDRRLAFARAVESEVRAAQAEACTPEPIMYHRRTEASKSA